MKTLSGQAQQLLETWKIKQLNLEDALQSLQNEALQEEDKAFLIESWKKYLSQQRQRPGFLYMGLGSFLGFLACVFTMVDVAPSLNSFFLYGLTSFAILVVLYGCYLVFE